MLHPIPESIITGNFQGFKTHIKQNKTYLVHSFDHGMKHENGDIFSVFLYKKNMKDKYKKLHYLVDKLYQNKEVLEYEEPMTSSIMNKDFQLTKLLLDKGFSPNVVIEDYYVETPLEDILFDSDNFHYNETLKKYFYRKDTLRFIEFLICHGVHFSYTLKNGKQQSVFNRADADQIKRKCFQSLFPILEKHSHLLSKEDNAAWKAFRLKMIMK